MRSWHDFCLQRCADGQYPEPADGVGNSSMITTTLAGPTCTWQTIRLQGDFQLPKDM